MTKIIKGQDERLRAEKREEKTEGHNRPRKKQEDQQQGIGGR